MIDTSLTGDARLAEIARFQSGMCGEEFFLMHRDSLDSSRKEELMLPHHAWLENVEKQGQMVLSGARFHRDGSKDEGLTIIRASGWDEAVAIADSDPFVVEGVVTYRLEKWRIGGGRLTVSVDMTDMSCRLI